MIKLTTSSLCSPSFTAAFSFSLVYKLFNGKGELVGGRYLLIFVIFPLSNRLIAHNEGLINIS